MNRRIQKPMCILLSVMTMLAVLLGTSMSTMAADTTNITSIRKGIYSTTDECFAASKLYTSGYILWRKLRLAYTNMEL